MANDIEKSLKTLDYIKALGGWIFAAASALIAVVFWVQTQGNDKYYPKLAGENLEKQLTKIEQHMDVVELQNVEIIRLLGRIEGSQSHKR